MFTYQNRFIREHFVDGHITHKHTNSASKYIITTVAMGVWFQVAFTILHLTQSPRTQYMQCNCHCMQYGCKDLQATASFYSRSTLNARQCELCELK